MRIKLASSKRETMNNYKEENSLISRSTTAVLDKGCFVTRSAIKRGTRKSQEPINNKFSCSPDHKKIAIETTTSVQLNDESKIKNNIFETTRK